MPITVEMITLIISIGGPLLVGAFALWKMIMKSVKDSLKSYEDRMAAFERKEDKLSERIDKVEKTAVTKEDYNADRENFNRAMSDMALSLREGLATVTGRIDLVLFEIGRRERDGK